MRSNVDAIKKLPNDVQEYVKAIQSFENPKLEALSEDENLPDALRKAIEFRLQEASQTVNNK